MPLADFSCPDGQYHEPAGEDNLTELPPLPEDFTELPPLPEDSTHESGAEFSHRSRRVLSHLKRRFTEQAMEEIVPEIDCT